MSRSRSVPTALVLILVSGLLRADPARGADHGWTGTLSYALFRNSPEYPRDDFHDNLSATFAALWATSSHLSIGPEVGYHGVETISGIQCGPEWGVDCPSPDNLRAGAWQGVALVRWQSKETGLRPYAVAGAGPYLAGNLVVASREAKIHHSLEPGVTAGLGVRAGVLGIEGRWHYIADGLANSQYDFQSNTRTYFNSPLRIYSASVSLNFP